MAVRPFRRASATIASFSATSSGFTGQRNLSKWHVRRVENGYEPRTTLIEKRGDLSTTITDLAEHYDHVIVDVAGDDNSEMRTAMAVADQLIVVLRPSQFDAETLEEFVDVIKAAQVFNPGLAARALFSQVPTYNGGTETEDDSEYVAESRNLKPSSQPSLTGRSFVTR